MLVVEGKETIGIQFIDTEYLFDKRKGLVSIQVMMKKYSSKHQNPSSTEL